MKMTFAAAVAAIAMTLGAGLANATAGNGLPALHSKHAQVVTVAYVHHHKKHCWKRHGHWYCKK